MRDACAFRAWRFKTRRRQRVERMSVAIRLAFVTGLSLPLLSGAAGAADLLVLKSSHPALPAGQILNSARPLMLPAGTKLTVLNHTGEKFHITGPYSGTPDSRRVPQAKGVGAYMLDALSRLLAGRSPSNISIGASRGVANVRFGPAWSVNVTRPGGHCLPTGAPATLWRARARKAETLHVRGSGAGQRAHVPWPAGQETVRWPNGVDLRDGGTYLLRVDNGPAISKVVIRMVPDDLPTDYHRVAWMAEAGCMRQALTLLRTLT